jgi:hypothetical protein
MASMQQWFNADQALDDITSGFFEMRQALLLHPTSWRDDCSHWGAQTASCTLAQMGSIPTYFQKQHGSPASFLQSVG